jgi:crotonobetainyl-CoA:carnitine CoA-transferase CaiB-like acyl-CoA transferase
MGKVKSNNAALDDLRVLDLAGQIGLYCTKQLADLGADVIKIEPPGGDPMRKIGPFYQNEVHPEKSLYWFHFNTNKKSITLDIETEEGREIFRKLAKTADIVVETFSQDT